MIKKNFYLKTNVKINNYQKIQLRLLLEQVKVLKKENNF